MKQIAAQICDILYDYHVDRGFKFTDEHIIKWVSQFDATDQKFILEEFLHLLKTGIYINKSEARRVLIEKIKVLAKTYKFSTPILFLKNVDFLSLQEDGKSQNVLLNLLNEELIKAFNISLENCGTSSRKYAIYIDDMLATGGTVFNDCSKWLETLNADGEANFQKIIKKEKILIVSLFCKHTWGAFNVRIRLKMKLNNDSVFIKYHSTYNIENHPTEPDQKMNLAYPVNSNIKEVSDYFSGLTAIYKAEFAFRKNNIPVKEQFFSSAVNRIRFENIMLIKGISLLGGVRHLQVNYRPLGVTTPTKKHFGTGTLFFTWRNISNTTPIVFWWHITGSDWYPLFPLSNRGKN